MFVVFVINFLEYVGVFLKIIEVVVRVVVIFVFKFGVEFIVYVGLG